MKKKSRRRITSALSYWNEARLPAAAAVAAATTEVAAAAEVATAAKSAATPVTRTCGAHIGLARVALETTGIACTPTAACVGWKLSGLRRRDAAATAEEFVAEPRTPEAAEQTAPKTTAATVAAVTRSITGPVTWCARCAWRCSRRSAWRAAIEPRRGGCAQDGTNDQKADDGDDDPPKHRDMKSSDCRQRARSRRVETAGSLTRAADVRAIDVENGSDCAGNAGVVRFAAELGFH